MLEIISEFRNLESPRIRDVERRFLQRFGWKARVVSNEAYRCVWVWEHPDYSRSYYRGQAFAREFARQAR